MLKWWCHAYAWAHVQQGITAFIIENTLLHKLRSKVGISYELELVKLLLVCYYGSLLLVEYERWILLHRRQSSRQTYRHDETMLTDIMSWKQDTISLLAFLWNDQMSRNLINNVSLHPEALTSDKSQFYFNSHFKKWNTILSNGINPRNIILFCVCYQIRKCRIILS